VRIEKIDQVFDSLIKKWKQ